MCLVSSVNVFLQDSGLKPSSQHEYDIQIDSATDRDGGDFSGMPLYLDSAADSTDCALLCAAREGCEAFSFDTCGNPPRCWLKSSIPGTSGHSCRVSAKFYT